MGSVRMCIYALSAEEDVYLCSSIISSEKKGDSVILSAQNSA